MSGKKKGKSKSEENEFTLIKNVVDKQNIRIDDVKVFASIDYPIFSFKYLQDVSVKDCKSPDFFKEFLFRLKKLSELGWNEIAKSDRHSFGTEKIPYKQIKPKNLLPKFITPEVDLTVFRATGSNFPFVGFRESKIFHVIFIETQFGDIYDHG